MVKAKHIGEIEGIPATGKEVSVPLCITYFLKDGIIQEAHIYILNDLLMQQLGVKQASSNAKTTYLIRYFPPEVWPIQGGEKTTRRSRGKKT